MNKLKKIMATVLATAMAMTTISLTACDLGGSREITGIVITESSVDLTYTVGEDVSFADMIVKAKFNDESEEAVSVSKIKVYLNGENITANLNKITETVGTKTVTVEYEGKKATLTFTVSSDTEGGDDQTPTTTIVAGYEAPASYTAHKAQKEAAGKEYETDGYETSFFKGETAYLAGDDNAFKFVPTMRVMGANGPETLLSFETSTVISIKKDAGYSALSSRAGSIADTVEYYEEDTVYVTAYTKTNSYDFTDAAIGQAFELKVLPGNSYVGTDLKAVVCEVSIVDGFNVYTAKELSVVHNYNNTWDNIKESLGLLETSTKAIVLQNDIRITKEDIPETYYYTLSEPVNYYDSADENKETPLGQMDTYLYDRLDLIERTIEQGDSFAIYGNYYSLDLSELPLVASFDNEKTDDYGGDTSNTTLLKVRGGETGEGEPADFAIEDLNIIGNANISDAVDHTEENRPIYAGGALFTKLNSEYGALNASIKNTIARRCFIAYFPEYDSTTINLTDVKCYDSYQNAIFAWSGASIDLQNCNFERTGGPLILMQHRDPETDSENARIPTATADENCIFVNYVTGAEFWFGTVGATSAVGQVKALNAVFNAFGRSMLKDNKFNMICLVMSSGDSANTTMLNIDTQGKFSYKGQEINRMKTDPTWATLCGGYMTMAKAGGQAGVTLHAGNSLVIMNGETPVYGDLSAFGLGANDPSNFATSEYVALNLGGFGLFLQTFAMA